MWEKETDWRRGQPLAHAKTYGFSHSLILGDKHVRHSFTIAQPVIRKYSSAGKDVLNPDVIDAIVTWRSVHVRTHA